MKALPILRSCVRTAAGILLILAMAGCLNPVSPGAVDIPRYSLTYDGNGATGGSVPVDYDSPYLPGDIVDIEMTTTLVRTGYSFEGWSMDSNAITAVWQVDSLLPRIEIGLSDVVLFAVWARVYAVGDTGPAGGIVFYDKGSRSDGWRFMEAALADCSDGMVWGPDNVGFLAASPLPISVGAGFENTQIIAGDSRIEVSAAHTCLSFESGGFQDWFLPSLDELKLMRLATPFVAGYPGIFEPDLYWSSSAEANNLLIFPGMVYAFNPKKLSSSTSYVGLLLHVRAARRF